MSKVRSISPEIEQAIADIRTLSDRIEAGAVKSPARTLADMFYKTVGMIMLAGPAGAVSQQVTAKPKRQRRPPLAALAKHHLEMKVEPDGSFVVAPGKPAEGEVTSADRNPWLDEIEKMTKQ